MLVFNSPWYLLLLLLLPAMWWFSFHSLSGLGRWRRLIALGLRTLVMLLLVARLRRCSISGRATSSRSSICSINR